MLFYSNPPSIYKEPDNFDDADLSDFIFGSRYISIADKFVYLGIVTNREYSDEADVNPYKAATSDNIV